MPRAIARRGRGHGHVEVRPQQDAPLVDLARDPDRSPNTLEVMRPDLAAQMTRLMTNSNSCTASFTQIAGVEALRGDQSSVDHMRDEFKRRRDAFVDGLNQVKGFSCRMPKGAFYAFPNITKTGWPSKKLANALLEEAGVACLSGTAFGDYGEGFLRFSVANSLENLNKALDRINHWTAKNL